VDKLIGLHLSLQFASPDEVSQALRSETITGTQLVDRRTKVLSLSYACPHNCGKPRDCPFSEIRKKNNYEKCQWIESLSQACLRDLITFHQKCLAKKMKLKPQPRLMEGAKSKC